MGANRRDLIDKPFDNRADIEDLISAYRLILGRNPDKIGYDYFEKLIKGGMPVDTLFLKLISSDEYKDKNYTSKISSCQVNHKIRAKCRNLIAHADSFGRRILASNRARAYNGDAVLSKHHIDINVYERLYSDLISHQPEDTREYFQYHKQRYYELFNAMAYYLKGKTSPRILEIGVSGFLPLYKKLFPNIVLITIDRPIGDHGFDNAHCVGIRGPEHHYNLDLNLVSLSPDFHGDNEFPLGKFDYIIFTEVIEHLIANPVELLSGIISLLEPDGYLYLTTPNFFQYGYLRKIENRDNPQPIFPRRGKNFDAHHHFREYSMNELIKFIDEAGGDVVNHYFSDCWDDPKLIEAVLRFYPDQKSNLVIIAKASNSQELGIKNEEGP